MARKACSVRGLRDVWTRASSNCERRNPVNMWIGGGGLKLDTIMEKGARAKLLRGGGTIGEARIAL
eukprot:9755085-Alexandrium_andersonii.AAC.1